MVSSKKMEASMLSILVTFLCISKMFVCGEYAKFEMLELPTGVKGSGGLAFRTLTDEEPYVTTLDGRIMKWNGTTTSFEDFAYTSPNRTTEVCDGVEDPDMWSTCGRPFALTFDPETNISYVADAYHGLLSVGPLGGLATQLFAGFKFANGVDYDLKGKQIYFSEASFNYDVRDAIQPGFMPDASGILLHYVPIYTSKVSVLLNALRGAGGPAVSSDGTFVVISEIGNDQITKFWLEGDKKYTSELLLNVNGNPNKITRAEKAGEFWVATTRIGYVTPNPIIIPEGVRFNSDGQVLETVQFVKEYPDEPISMIQEHQGKLYVASQYTNFIGVYSN